ncbi:hypothetical protein F4776DRAFT_658291 [Hypoxylon sp. NC0597]|nr:hypothetical protein F4776DRAFT_658291 [Hypoxylon sp. NC0597]
MNGTDLQPVSTLVNSPSTHGLPPAGVMSIDRTSCKTRKRPRSPPPANYSHSPSSPFSRFKKTNTSKGYVPKPSSPSSPLLARTSLSRIQNTAAEVAVVSPLTAVAASTVELGAFRHHNSETKWNHPIPSGPLDYGEELIVSDTFSRPRNYLTLSSSLAQTPDPSLYDWPRNDPDLLTLNSQPFPMFHQPALYHTTHENPPHENLSRDYSVDYSGITTQGYSAYPLPSPLDAMSAPSMIMELRPFLGDEASMPGRSEEDRMDDIQLDDWQIVEQPVEEFVKPPIEDSDPSFYDGLRQISNLFSGNASALVEEGNWEHIVFPEQDNVATDENRSPSLPRAQKRPRRCLDDQARKNAGKTRKLKACIRCRMQKIKCVPDPENPEGEGCLTCRNINLDSKKVIHRHPCLRFKLAEIILFREGGLNLTKRWAGVKMKNLGPRDWTGEKARTIALSIGCTKHPFRLTVRRFVPKDGDTTWKYWVDSEGTRRKTDIEPYALADIWKTANEYKEYVHDYKFAALREYANKPGVDVLVQKTYKAALEYVRKLEAHPAQVKGEDVNPYIFLNQYFTVWFSIRNAIGSAFIVGDDKLDMIPEKDPECPYYGKVCAPRMIPAQFDSLGYDQLLMPVRKLVLEGLWRMMASKNPRHFYTVYLTVFMLLHEVSVSSADRLRHARDNQYRAHRYTLPWFVERLQEGANVILGHWHYYKRDINTLMDEIEAEDKKKAVWAELNPDEIQLLAETRKIYKEREDLRSASTLWEHDLWFVSQMFEESWNPKETFSW